LAILVFAPAATLMFTGCSSESKERGASMGAAQLGGQEAATLNIRPGEPGGEVVQTHEETATVVAIDKADRRLTLLTPGGTQTTFRVGPEVVNFDQIEPGDRVKATVTEQLLVFMRDSHEPPREGQSRTIALAPVGSKPGVVMADTVEMTARVTAIDLQHHRATIQFPDGRTQTFTVRSDVDLTKRRVGEQVVIRSTEATAIRVEKP